MDAARAAAMSDPKQNPHFRRRWEDEPQPDLTPVQASPDGPLEITGLELLEQWRRERALWKEGR